MPAGAAALIIPAAAGQLLMFYLESRQSLITLTATSGESLQQQVATAIISIVVVLQPQSVAVAVLTLPWEEAAGRLLFAALAALLCQRGCRTARRFLEDAAEAVSWSRDTGAEQSVLICYNAGAWCRDAETLPAGLHGAQICLPAAARCSLFSFVPVATTALYCPKSKEQ